MCKVCTPHLRPCLVNFAGFGPWLCFFLGRDTRWKLLQRAGRKLPPSPLGRRWVDFKRKGRFQAATRRCGVFSIEVASGNVDFKRFQPKSDGLLPIPAASNVCRFEVDRTRRKVDRRKASQEMLLTRTLLGAPGLTTRSNVRY